MRFLFVVVDGVIGLKIVFVLLSYIGVVFLDAETFLTLVLLATFACERHNSASRPASHLTFKSVLLFLCSQPVSFIHHSSLSHTSQLDSFAFAVCCVLRVCHLTPFWCHPLARVFIYSQTRLKRTSTLNLRVRRLLFSLDKKYKTFFKFEKMNRQ